MTDIKYLGEDEVQAFHRYQLLARSTAVYPARGMPVGRMYAALGLCGEAGEAAEQVKKMWRNHNGEMTPQRKAAIKNEIGDVLWYAALLCEECGLNLGTCALENIHKLQVRSAQGALKHE
jgi:NTP pyrophosphatase (non-canonical NTP hydrolase)